ncbi:uncharacterized protein PV06_08210 [Exophiala oligosperma]|uniref:Uncharacterized protein n=1 Tax=Exophiala oligosperma TaxID=215243 RepID=A0A0D2BPY8_9EURO|nr:uncharacterized protein PV06_08210 [Exophiala oligosperma]KIW39612.1 hypothetical protein PV06_08210 [Exophiala oligosperma]
MILVRELGVGGLDLGDPVPTCSRRVFLTRGVPDNGCVGRVWVRLFWRPVALTPGLTARLRRSSLLMFGKSAVDAIFDASGSIVKLLDQTHVRSVIHSASRRALRDDVASHAPATNEGHASEFTSACKTHFQSLVQQIRVDVSTHDDETSCPRGESRLCAHGEGDVGQGPSGINRNPSGILVDLLDHPDGTWSAWRARCSGIPREGGSFDHPIGIARSRIAPGGLGREIFWCECPLAMVSRRAHPPQAWKSSGVSRSGQSVSPPWVDGDM